MTLSQQVAQLEARTAKLQRQVDDMTEERSALRDRVVELESLLKIKDVGLPPLDLPPKLHRLLNMLMARELVPNEIAGTVIDRDTSMRTLDNHYMRLKKALPAGVTIKNQYGVGRYIPKEQKILLRAGMGK